MSFTESLLPEIVKRNHNGLLSKHGSWGRVALGHVAEILNGFAFKSKHFNASKGKPLVRIRDVIEGQSETYYNGDFDPGYLVGRGDLLVGMDGDFHCACWHGPEALLNQRVCRMTPDERVYDKGFLTYVLPGYLSAINDHTSSVTVKHLSSRTAAKIPLPLPSVDEQRRIVEKIEELLTDLDAGVAALMRARRHLRRYRASVLKAAVEGRLTERWRQNHPEAEPASALLARILVERRARWIADQLDRWRTKQADKDCDTDKIAKAEPKERQKIAAKYKEPAAPDATNLPDLPSGWCWVTVEQLTCHVTKGSSPGWQGFEYQDSGITFLRSQNVRWGTLDLSELAYLDPAFNESHRNSIIRDGDVLLNLVGASIGRAAIASMELDGANLNQAVAIIRLSSAGASNRYLVAYLISPVGQHHIHSTKADVARANFNLDDVRPMPVALPPVSEQTEIVSLVEDKFSIIEATERTISKQLQRAGRLRQSILKRAFDGKLIPQDPNDEPAEALLARIRAQRAAQAAASTGKSRPRAKRTRRKAKHTTRGKA